MKQTYFFLMTGLKKFFFRFAIHSFLFIFLFLFSACVDKGGFINNVKGSNDIHLLSDEIQDGNNLGTLEVREATTYELNVPIELDVSLSLNDAYQFVSLDFKLWNQKEGSHYVYLDNPSGLIEKHIGWWEGIATFTLYSPGNFTMETSAVIVDLATNELYRIKGNELKIEIDYPNADFILADSKMDSEAESCWSDTKRDFCEYGFAIYLKNGEIELESTQYGETIECPDSEGEFLAATVEIEISETAVNPTQADGLYLVGIFHTHPPLTNCDETAWRKPGPSDEDNSNYDKLEYAVPAFVYDYDTEKLCGGHDVDMSGKIFKYGVERRDCSEDEYDSYYDWE